MMRTRGRVTRPSRDGGEGPAHAWPATTDAPATGNGDTSPRLLRRKTTRTSSNLSARSNGAEGDESAASGIFAVVDSSSAKSLLIKFCGVPADVLESTDNVYTSRAGRKTRKRQLDLDESSSPTSSPTHTSPESQNSQFSIDDAAYGTATSQNGNGRLLGADPAPADVASATPSKSPSRKRVKRSAETDYSVLLPQGEAPPGLGQDLAGSSSTSKPHLRVETAENVGTNPSQSMHGGRSLLPPARSPLAQSVAEDVSDDDLSESDFPAAYGPLPKTPGESDCEDEADFILKTKFLPMTDPQLFIAALTKRPPSERSTEALFLVAENAQRALEQWQDEFLDLDKRTAPLSNPPKKPATGGRTMTDPDVFDATKRAELWGYAYDSRKAATDQDPWAQRLHIGKDGRSLRQRRPRETAKKRESSIVISGDESGGIATRRKRRATTKLGTGTASTPEPPVGIRTGRGRGRGKRLSPDPGDDRPRKRGRWANRPAAGTAAAGASGTASALPQRLQEMRASSAFTTDGEESDVTNSTTAANDQAALSATGQSETPPPSSGRAPKRRGRPPGSKNVSKRSDAGIKKGPRKTHVNRLERLAPTPEAQAIPAANPLAASADMNAANGHAVQSSEGQQNQSQTSLQSEFSPPSQSLQPQAHPSQSIPNVDGKLPISRLAVPPNPPPRQSAGIQGVAATPFEEPSPDAFVMGAGSQSPAAAAVGGEIADASLADKRKQRVKSEKRSQSMTIWWANRKKRQEEHRAANMKEGEQAISGIMLTGDTAPSSLATAAASFSPGSAASNPVPGLHGRQSATQSLGSGMTVMPPPAYAGHPSTGTPSPIQHSMEHNVYHYVPLQSQPILAPAPPAPGASPTLISPPASSAYPRGLSFAYNNTGGRGARAGHGRGGRTTTGKGKGRGRGGSAASHTAGTTFHNSNVETMGAAMGVAHMSPPAAPPSLPPPQTPAAVQSLQYQPQNLPPPPTAAASNTAPPLAHPLSHPHPQQSAGSIMQTPLPPPLSSQQQHGQSYPQLQAPPNMPGDWAAQTARSDSGPTPVPRPPVRSERREGGPSGMSHLLD